MRALWISFHDVTYRNSHNGFDSLLSRLSLSLLDPTYIDPHPWIVKVRTGVLDADGHHWRVPDFVDLRQMSSVLGNEIGQMRLPFDARTFPGTAPYRDDNTHLWVPETVQSADDQPDPLQQNEPGQAVCPVCEAPEDQSAWYPEWDERIGRMRPEWCRVVSRTRPASIRLVSPHADPASRRLARICASQLHGMRAPGGVASEGQHLHPMAALDAHMDRLRGHTPDWRVFRGERATMQPLAVWMLLDASASMKGAAHQAHQLALQVIQVLGLLGHRTAVWTLSSFGRKQVAMTCLKQWDEPLSQYLSAFGQADAFACEGSSRLGVGVRHGLAEHAEDARHRPGWRRLVLVVTDGDLHDIDVHDPDYLYGDLAHCRAEAVRVQVALRGLLHTQDKTNMFHAVLGMKNCAVAPSGQDLPAVLKRLLAS